MDDIARFVGLGVTGMSHEYNFLQEVAYRTVSDAKGWKLRVQTSDVAKQILQQCASPQAMAFSEVYGGLQTGVVDGQETLCQNILTRNI